MLKINPHFSKWAWQFHLGMSFDWQDDHLGLYRLTLELGPWSIGLDLQLEKHARR